MDYSNNLKLKDIIIKILSFIIYFSIAGFMGKLCAILTEPAFTLILKLLRVKNFPETTNLILYIIKLIIMFSAVSFFSKREGFNDIEKLRFAYKKTIISYLSAGAVFIIIAIIALKSDIIREYVLTSYFFPDELRKIIYGSVFFANNPILYYLFDKIKYFILLKWTSPCLTVCINIIFAIIFYGKGRIRWTEKKNDRIRQLKQIQNIPRYNNKNKQNKQKRRK